MSSPDHAFSAARTLEGWCLRYPFSSQALLDELMGRPAVEAALRSGGSRVRALGVAGLGVCYASRAEPNATLMGVHRYAAARLCALAVMGAGAFRLGLSPGLDADGEFFWAGGWWRVWVDLGSCAPEALRFIDSPPGAFGSGVRDWVLVAGEARLEQVTRLVERAWSASSQPVTLTCVSLGPDGSPLEIGDQRSIRSQGRRLAKAWSMPSKGDYDRYFKTRQRSSRHTSLLGEIARQVEVEGWHLLLEVGSNPLMSRRELAVLASPDRRAQAAVLRSLSDLERLRLIETPATCDPMVTLESRKVLTWRGVELLAAHAGTTVETLRRRQPWPLRIDPRSKGKTVYSTRWLRGQSKHHGLTRAFALSLVESARRVSRPTGGVEVEIVSTIGGRLLYEDRNPSKEGSIGYVAPDAVAWVQAWDAPWLEGRVGRRRPLGRATLLVEMDRSTMPLSRVRQRLNRYADVWPAMPELRPGLAWVIDGTPYREAQVLAMLAERGLDGWTVTLDRLSLNSEAMWWLQHPLVSCEPGSSAAGLDPSELGGMCPWRSVWSAPGRSGFGPLLDLEPWRGAGLVRSSSVEVPRIGSGSSRRGEKGRIAEATVSASTSPSGRGDG